VPVPSPAEVAQKLTKKEWSAILSLIVLCALNVPFWAVYEQQGNTMQTWADRQTIWPVIAGFQVPSSWFQSFNPAMIILLTPLINGFWEYQSRRGREPSTVAKMAIGSFILGSSFIIMVVGARAIGDGRGSFLWPFGATMVLTVGELYVSPIGLSLVTKASPKRLVSLMMGIWFVASFLGGFASGVLGVFYTKMPRESFFWMLTILGLATGAAMWAMGAPIKKALGENA
jgi:proton-dependent oligopeptide transporter, POT family